MLIVEFFIIGFIGSFIISQFAMVQPRRVPMSETRYRELRFRRLIEGGRVRWESYGRPTTSSLAWA